VYQDDDTLKTFTIQRAITIAVLQHSSVTHTCAKNREHSNEMFGYCWHTVMNKLISSLWTKAIK